jgi:C1A family cysteine protease
MVVVGYGIDAKTGKKYWKLKNSWGLSWGVEGYLYILRNGDGPG